MTPEQFQQIRETMGLSRREFAALLGYANPEQDYNIITRLETGKRPISPMCERLVLMICVQWFATELLPDFDALLQIALSEQKTETMR